MPLIGPPLEVMVSSEDDSPLRRARFRIWQIALASITITVCAWCWTIGPLLGSASTFLAKHVLVGIYAAGLHFDRRDIRQ